MDDLIKYKYRNGFFFSSRRRHTRCSRDWSSDVCSSDLESDLERLQQEHGFRSDELHQVSRERDAFHAKVDQLAKEKSALQAALDQNAREKASLAAQLERVLDAQSES